jgi:O-antigen/teichoic acid export membrane protein
MPAPWKEIAGRILNDKNYREIISNSAANFSVRIFGIIFGYLFIAIISRLYGPDVLGSYTLSVTVLMIFAIVGRLGMDTAIVKHFASATQEGRWDKVRETYLKTLSVVFPLGVVLSVILYLTAPYIASGIFHKPHLTPYLQTISFAVLPLVMKYITSECYRGFKKIALYAYNQNVSYFLYGSVILGVLSLFNKSPLNPGIAYAISLAILLFIGVFFIYRRISANTNKSSSEWTHKGLVKFALPMMLTGSLMLISGWINTIILGIYSTEADVGIYSVILKIATLSSFVLLSINSIAAPRFAQLNASGDQAGLAKYAGQTAKVIFFSSLPIFFAIIFLRKWLLLFFGNEFIIGSAALLVVMSGQFFNFFAGSVGHYLNMTGHQKEMRNIVMASAVINIIACFIFIPKYGLMGSAIASAIFMASWNITAMVYIKNKFGVRTYYWPSKFVKAKNIDG